MHLLYESKGTNTASIAAGTGAVTFVRAAPDFSGDQFGIGMVIEIGSEKYTIDKIAAGGAVTIKPAPSASIIGVYKINLPSLRLGPFIAAVRAVGNFELAAEGNLSTTLELTPNTQLPDWVIV